MIAFRITSCVGRRGYLGSFHNIIKKAVYNQSTFRKFSISAAIDYQDNIFKSPSSTVDIPNLSLIDFLVEKSKPHDDKIALVS